MQPWVSLKIDALCSDLSIYFQRSICMAVSSSGMSKSQPTSLFEIKSSELPLVSLVIKNGDLTKIAQELLGKFGPSGETPDFFDNDPLVLDFSHLVDASEDSDLTPLLDALTECRLKAVAIRSNSGNYLQQCLAKGLVEAPAELTRKSQSDKTVSAPLAVQEEKTREVVREVVREVSTASTLVVDKPLRSGQKVYARGADLVVLAMVNAGAEVVADGNIHVYAPLRGKAMAGASGNTRARIFSLCLEAELISIAGVYRTSENPLPPTVLGKAAQVRLSDDGQEKLLIEALTT